LSTANWLPAWGHRKAADIARKDVIAVLDRIVERGADVMANRTRALISKIYNFAILDRGMVEHNPAYKVANPGEEHQRDRVLTQTEIRALWTALEKQPDPIAAVFKLALLTAQRRGEVLGMAWSELDLDAVWWTIPGRARQEQTRPSRTLVVPSAGDPWVAAGTRSRRGVRGVPRPTLQANF
jgi:integrase